MTELPHVEIATDGACKGNPGPGGWGAVIRSGAREKDISEPAVPLEEKLASPDGIETTPRTSTSFLGRSEACDFIVGTAINMRTTVVAADKIRNLITIGPFRAGSFNQQWTLLDHQTRGNC